MITLPKCPVCGLDVPEDEAIEKYVSMWGQPWQAQCRHCATDFWIHEIVQREFKSAAHKHELFIVSTKNTEGKEL